MENTSDKVIISTEPTEECDKMCSTKHFPLTSVVYNLKGPLCLHQQLPLINSGRILKRHVDYHSLKRTQVHPKINQSLFLLLLASVIFQP